MNKERKHLKTVIGKSNREKYDTWYIMEKNVHDKKFHNYISGSISEQIYVEK